MRERIAAICAVAGLVAAAFLLNRQGEAPPGRPQNQSDPERVLRKLFEAARRGDLEAYLALLGGELRTRVCRALRQQGEQRFKVALAASMRGLKGLALRRKKVLPEGRWIVEAELVFSDRIERQELELTPQEGSFRVTAASEAEVRTPSVPYGTPVFEE